MHFGNNKNQKIIIWIILCLITLVTIYPFFKIGIATADDLSYYQLALKNDLWAFALYSAKAHGRFYYAITLPIYYIPYAFDNYVYVKVIQFSSMLISIYLFSVVLKKIFKSPELGMLFLVIFLSAFSLSKWTSLIVAYIFYFHFSFTLILLSILLLIKYFEDQKNKFLIASAILYFGGLLFYEIYLIYLLIVGIILLYYIKKEQRKNSSRFPFKRFLQHLFPFAVAAILYLSIYLTFYLIYPSSYSGNSFASSNLSSKNIFAVLTNYAESAFPLSVYYQSKNLFVENHELISGHKDDILYICQNSNPLWIIRAIAITFLFFYLIPKLPRLKNITILGCLLSSLILIYLTHLPLAFTQKYGLEYYYIKGYVTTYYSYYGVALLISILFYLLYRITLNNKFSRLSFFTICSICLFVYSIKTSYSNYYIAKDMARPKFYFDMIDSFCQSEQMKNTPENAIVYAHDLWESRSSYIELYNQGFNWKDYIYLRTKKQFHTIRSYDTFYERKVENPSSPTYFLSKKEFPGREGEALLIFSPIDSSFISKDEIKLVSNRVSLFCYTKNKDFSISFLTKGIATQNEKIIIGPHTYPFKGNQIRFNVQNEKVDYYTLIEITAPEIDLSSFILSDNLIQEKKSSPLH